jgi:hypothetical protein
MADISKREKRLIAVAAIIGLVFAFMQYLVFPYWDSLSETSERVNIQAKRVASYRQILRGHNSVKAALEAAQQQTAALETGLLISKSDALANGEIQGLVKELAASKGMNFRSSDTLAAKYVSPEYTKVSARFVISGTMDQLVSFLAAFEPAAKILFVEEMRITPLQMGNPKNKQVLATLLVSALKPTDQSHLPPTKKL